MDTNSSPLRLWLRLIAPFSLVYLGIQILTRIGLLIYSGQSGDVHGLQWATIFGWGFLFDLCVLGLFLLPVIAIHLVAKAAAWTRAPLRVTRLIIFFIYTYIWLFTAVSEYFFWEEFSTRFNFIAVDYLVYTTEVIGNIKESYPLYPLLAAIAATALVTTVLCKKMLRLGHADDSSVRVKPLAGLAIAAIPLLLLGTLNADKITLGPNQALHELATNGTYALFSAYRNNELSYKDFYMTIDEQTVGTRIRTLLKEDESEFVSQDPDDITRLIRRNGPELHKNVVLVIMESMSADFMATFGNRENLTPVLDGLTKQGLFFSNLYATGTRTVRGLEAITLSIPPTPGQSIVRRPENGGLFSLGYVFQDRGYDTAFIYGGHGYFDNMNAFFAANGFRVIDRHDFADGDVTFSNVWGVADEDLYNQVIKQADLAYEKKQPFMYEVMTTSNHRPYTFPEGRIDLPSKTGGRSAGVKYADYSVGKLLENARNKPWFKDTVFIFVADHTAGAGGKIELSPDKYHIPAIFYAPDFIKPQDYKLMASQIDVAPVLLGLLNFSYYTKFFGKDVLNDAYDAEDAYAFVSNYQKIAYLKDGQLTVLSPKAQSVFYDGQSVMAPEKVNQAFLTDTITYYQYASEWKKRLRKIPSVYKAGSEPQQDQ